METKTITWVQWAMFWLKCYDRMTNRFTTPLESYSLDQLTSMWYVDEWFLRVAPALMEKVLHPKHKPELRLAIAYLTALKEMQDEAWIPVFEKIKKDNAVITALERGQITKEQYLEYVING